MLIGVCLAAKPGDYEELIPPKKNYIPILKKIRVKEWVKESYSVNNRNPTYSVSKYKIS